jgi:hypothetical protein
MSWYKKLIEKVKKAYAKRNEEEKDKEKEFKTVRTSGIESQLKAAGLSDEQIAKLRGK